jgi:Arc/MetJ-type ribon-helix-helix transcriptional regulator
MRTQEIKINIKGLVDAGLYESEERAMQEALKALLDLWELAQVVRLRK